MNCETAQKELSLFLYGELSLEEEGILQEHLDACESCRQELEREEEAHRAAESIEFVPAPELLNRCRRDLRARLERESRPGVWTRLRRSFGFGLAPLAALGRPVGALALVALGFFAARFTAQPKT